jgi:hypothetical protein
MILDGRDNIAGLVGQVRTNRQARAVIGVASHYLSVGYAMIPRLATSSESFFNIFVPDNSLQAEARDLLDRTRVFAEGHYNVTPNDDQPFPAERMPALEAIVDQTMSSLRLLASIDAEMSANFLDEVADVFTAGVGTFGDILTRPFRADWRVFLVALVAVAAFLAWRKYA